MAPVTPTSALGHVRTQLPIGCGCGCGCGRAEAYLETTDVGMVL